MSEHHEPYPRPSEAHHRLVELGLLLAYLQLEVLAARLLLQGLVVLQGLAHGLEHVQGLGQA